MAKAAEEAVEVRKAVVAAQLELGRAQALAAQQSVQLQGAKRREEALIERSRDLQASQDCLVVLNPIFPVHYGNVGQGSRPLLYCALVGVGAVQILQIHANCAWPTLP